MAGGDDRDSWLRMQRRLVETAETAETAVQARVADA